MSDLQTAARRLAAIKVFEDMVSAEKHSSRAEVMQELLDAGITRLNIQMPDKTVLGTIGVTKGRETARIVDERAFLAWVRENAPEELIETVRDSYRRSVLKQIQGGGEIPDGVEMSQGGPYPTVRLAEGATEAVLAAVRSGVIEPLALPGGES